MAPLPFRSGAIVVVAITSQRQSMRKETFELETRRLDLVDQQISKDVAAGRIGGFEALRRGNKVEESRQLLQIAYRTHAVYRPLI